MSNIRELSFDELAQVSGGGNSGDHDRNFGRAASTNYGGQANGFQPNYAAIGGTGSCGPGTVAGLVGGIAAATVATGGLAAGIGFVGGVATGMIGGQCFPSGSSSSNSKNGPPFH
ncbi:hypothetical protein ACJVQT_20220 [Enterobacter huaxiensis]|uniref:hypothetical protein n=1 Tax=Enterobacter huaxiensis TaxID=2494702 RepID=UPI002175BBEC|nr:hypothetical protein [Enterobacter huaxiensis]MCS5452280.1 hypothetical protein [Enterobacter huaxiensis]